ncbi:SixA phosphatase family protein [Flavobacterium luteum]|uniref:Histidine phosphatase family protein n=1 Tax=Flavobacterium luteum TaxID=2026654 RepID=A0A7J5AKF5_9FLAO|nr:histidine phosphatase family protein [Flavobacterium luteum]KAB1158081.1 histidine phosphatase family protein [Flavobacterium luteum]
MKNLILIRHAKSSWDSPIKDIDRPLDIRGIKDAHLVAINCKLFLPKTYLIISSIAKRASETAIVFAQNILYPIENILFKEELYTFDETKLERIIKSLNNSYDNVILFGHNEAITNFVNKFGDVFIENVTTSGFVFLQFNSEAWQSIEKGKTMKIIFPKDLK